MANVQIIPNPNQRIVWLGDLENYMNDTFLRNAFQQAFATTENLIVHIKFPTSKFTGQLAGYCFIEFKDEETAQKALQTLNGKVIPGSLPPKRFRLNIAGERMTNSTPAASVEKKVVEYSVYVGDLDQNVEDRQLYDYFHKRFHSVTNANIIRDNEGKSKGFGFVRFSSEADQLKVLSEFNGSMFYGRPIKVNTAQPRIKDQQSTTRRTTGVTYPPPNYYNTQPYQGYNNYTYNQAPGYQQSYNQTGYTPTGSTYPPTQPPWGGPPGSGMYGSYAASSQSASQYQSSDVEPPVLRDDPEVSNKEFVDNRGEFWSSIHQSRFFGVTFPTSYLKDVPNDGVTPILY